MLSFPASISVQRHKATFTFIYFFPYFTVLEKSIEVYNGQKILLSFCDFEDILGNI